MGLYNLEKNIREKLENREIAPSKDAWRKLELQLGESKPTRGIGWYYYLAAGILVLLILSSVFIQNKNETENSLVKENFTKQENVEKQLEIVSHASDSSASKKSSSKEGPNNSKTEIKPASLLKESAVDKKFRKQEMLAESSETVKPQSKQTSILVEKKSENSFLDEKAFEVVASVRLLQDTNGEVTMDEVENLLNTAQRDIQVRRILHKPKVDATALLNDVEWDLEKSFRDKVFTTLGEGFNKIRTAFSGRND